MGKRSRVDPGHWEDTKLREVEEPVGETETEGAATERGGKPGGLQAGDHVRVSPQGGVIVPVPIAVGQN